jgi:hypothetical protein
VTAGFRWRGACSNLSGATAYNAIQPANLDTPLTAR